MSGGRPNKRPFAEIRRTFVTKALARASITMAKADLWRARLAVKALRRDQREAIAEVGEG